MIGKCLVSCKTLYKYAKPLLSISYSDYPWQRVASDMFEWNKQKCLLVINYYSTLINIVKLSTGTSCNVINHLKSIFDWHVILELLISNNGPQYSAKLFNDFSRDYGFIHITSSTHYPQGNGAAKRGVWRNYWTSQVMSHIQLYYHTVQFH